MKLGEFRRFDPTSTKKPPDTSRIPLFSLSSKTEAETSYSSNQTMDN